MHTDYARVFPEAQTVLRMFIDDVDLHAPGHLTGAYIIGSLALDDPQPGKSDIDIVLVRADGATNEESIAALTPAIEALRASYPRPVLDGIVLSYDDLRTGPGAMDGPRPVLFEGRLTLSGESSARNPVTWQTLRQSGITWRGTPARELDLHDDPQALRDWTRGNLESYWRPLHRTSGVLILPRGQWSLRPDFVEWVVLGATRLHATIRTGQVVSKTGAGKYALQTFDEPWHRIVREAMDIRVNLDHPTSQYRRAPMRRRRDARAYLAMVIEDALASGDDVPE